MRSDLIDISVVLVHETEKAVLVALDEEHEPVWLPKSAVEVEDSGKRTSTKRQRIVTVTLSEALATEKDLV